MNVVVGAEFRGAENGEVGLGQSGDADRRNKGRVTLREVIDQRLTKRVDGEVIGHVAFGVGKRELP